MKPRPLAEFTEEGLIKYSSAAISTAFAAADRANAQPDLRKRIKDRMEVQQATTTYEAIRNEQESLDRALERILDDNS